MNEKRPEGTTEEDNGEFGLICPHCGNDDLDSMFYCEYVPAQRRMSEIKKAKKGNKLTLLALADAEYIDESSVDPHVFCDGCCKEFGLPKHLKVDFE